MKPSNLKLKDVKVEDTVKCIYMVSPWNKHLVGKFGIVKKILPYGINVLFDNDFFIKML